MKVSKEKREELHRALVSAAVGLFVEKGVAGTTMREVAATAGVAPGTAYKYFPDREHLMHAYFEIALDDAALALSKIPEFEHFDFKEKLQAFLEALLTEFLAEREFVALALRNIVDAPLQSIGAMQPIKGKLVEIVRQYLGQAIESGELPPGLHNGFVVNVFWDYTMLVTLYWLKDTSEGFGKTSEFVDHSLELYVSMIRSGLVDKTARLAGFFLKNHLYGNLEPLTSLIASLSNLRSDVFRGPP